MQTPIKNPTFPLKLNCKVCKGGCRIVAVVDSSNSGLDFISGRKVTPYTGMPVYYYSCEICSFTFTKAFDRWRHEEWSRHIYNDSYALHDPEYLYERPKKYAEMFCLLPDQIRDLSILDYGSGLGLFEKNLRAKGFSKINSYDPYGNNVKPAAASYDLITSFEVFEHHPNPHKLFEEMRLYLKPNGAIFLLPS